METNFATVTNAAPVRAPQRASLRGHWEIARTDHWFKNIFVLPGSVAAIGMDPGHISPHAAWHMIAGLASVCLIASSNYVINEIMDAPFDRHHPTKRLRAIPSGRTSVPLAYLQWLALMIAGMAAASTLSRGLVVSVGALWTMGCVYNIPPIRSKDIPYLDVLSEAINNPLRLLAGWYMVDGANMPPASLLLAYWMIGCYFMAMKRVAEYRHIGDARRACAYRKAFRIFSEHGLLVSTMFYASAAMLFFGAFIMRYRLELILSVPLVAVVMASYLDLGLKENSAVQAPEKLYRQPRLMAAVTSCAIVMALLLFLDVPLLHRIFDPDIAPAAAQQIQLWTAH